MRPYKILCPVDFSDGSHQALRTAARLAKQGGGELVILHAWNIPAIAYADYVIPTAALQQITEEAERALEETVRTAEQLGAPRVTSRLVEGLAWRAITEAAVADPAIDLIVVGTHGRTGLAHVLFGSVAAGVVRHAPCPVLVVRPGNEPQPFVHALCPTDFGAGARAAAKLAADLVEPGGAGIEVLHVLELPVAFSRDVPFPETRDLDKRAAAALERSANELRTMTKVPVTMHSRIGWAGAEILHALDRDRSIDLVVMGSHGRTGLGRFLLGSVAEKVARHARCSVLVAHQRG